MWAHVTVAFAYDQHYSEVRPLMGSGGISRQALILVAAALGRYADYRTGRNARPTNARLARDTGLSIRQVQRGRLCLRLLGVATEVLRGRQRTRTERIISWSVGDRARGWASVWSLHTSPWSQRIHRQLSPHPLCGPLATSKSRSLELTTTSRQPHGRRKSGAQRRKGIDEAGLALARQWRTHPNSPPWCRKHSAHAWAALLAAVARHGWTPEDLNQVVTEWLGVGNFISDRPHRPIGLMGAILAWYGRDKLAERPCALDEAREAAALVEREAERIADQLERRERESRVLPAPDHPARVHGRAVAAAAAARGRQRRVEESATALTNLKLKVEAIRGKRVISENLGTTCQW